MTKLYINKYYKSFTKNLDFEYDKEGDKPAWIHIKESKFNARFLSVQTDTNSEIIYKRFTGNFYYPVNLVIDKKEEARFYQKYAQFYDNFTSKNNLPMAQFLLNKILDKNISKTAEILDIGCGTGIFSNLAAEKGFNNLTLLDINLSMLNVAKQKTNLKSAKFINIDINKAKLSQKYDAIVSVMMFDAINDKQLPKTLKYLSNSLKDGGSIFLIEDKMRPLYKDIFQLIEEGVTKFSNKNDLTKYFFVGRK